MPLELKAFAKLNLTLEVLGLRPDGFHEIRSIFQPIALCDRVVVERTGRPGIELSCPMSDLPTNEGNLAFRAAAAFFEAAGLEGGLSIELYKEIPVAAGLGGGSSDAAAVLTGANSLFGRPFDSAGLERLAVQLGADVPFFIRSRPALARGKGEILEPIELPAFHFVLINPGFEVQTAWAYSQLRKPLTPQETADRIGLQFVAAVDDLRHLGNDLEPVVEKAQPIIGELKRRLLAVGASLARMSGSGPTVYGVFEDRREAERAADLLEVEETWQVILTQGFS